MNFKCPIDKSSFAVALSGPHNCGGGACGRQKWRTGWSSDYHMIGRITKFIAILLMRENGLQAILFMVNTWTPTGANFCPRVRLSCRDFSAAINPHFEGGAECLLKLMSCNPAGPKDNTKQQLQRIRIYPGPTKIGPRRPPPKRATDATLQYRLPPTPPRSAA